MRSPMSTLPLVIALYGKSCERAQQVCFLAMLRQVLDRLIYENARLLLGPVGAEDRNERRLASFGILPCPLARGVWITGMIDEVVGDLESETDISSVTAIWGPRFGRQPGHDARRLDRIFDERTRLELLQAGDRRKIQRLPFCGKVHHLAARHARRSGGLCKLEHQVGPDERIFMRLRVRENLEGERVKTVPGEYRGSFAESLMHGRLATPNVIIVHAGQVIVDERIDVDGLDGGADPKRQIPGNSKQA